MSPRAMHRPSAPPVVLASASRTRARLLEAAGVRFRVRVASIDEPAVRAALRAEGVSAQDAAIALAELKAQRAAAQEPGDALVIGADQILSLGDAWLDKPADRAAARAQLLGLRGRRHELVSAAVVMRAGARIWHQAAVARLWVRPFSEAFLDVYLDAAGDAVSESVGGYALEGLGAQLFARVDGDFFAVLGLPLLPLLECLRVQEVLPT